MTSRPSADSDVIPESSGIQRKSGVRLQFAVPRIGQKRELEPDPNQSYNPAFAFPRKIRYERIV